MDRSVRADDVGGGLFVGRGLLKGRDERVRILEPGE